MCLKIFVIIYTTNILDIYLKIHLTMSNAGVNGVIYEYSLLFALYYTLLSILSTSCSEIKADCKWNVKNHFSIQ